MLSEQLRLTTNPLTSVEGISYRTEQVYVPLGLVERKKQARRREDIAPEQGSQLYQETEITQTFEHQQFLERVLQQRQSPKSQGKRIAIIGEPGAGKTTLLQQIARWVSEEIPYSMVIWVSLADLRGWELEAYLFEVWLQGVVRKVGQAEASNQIKNDFVAQFNQGLVWLLLDGVDEMQATVGNPLAEINRQLRTGTLLQQARIVLSCRLNLWDGGSNALDSFDNYRTLEFSYPQQVEQFIGNWFTSLSSAEIQTGQRLCAALAESGKERIRDLVKNPLRLTLLCFNWYLGEGKLPETKAGLYEQFVADFYEWKKGQFATTGEQRKRLNAALGELAREAIDKEETRFRLRQEFVCEYLEEPDDADSLFGLALRLGWLNKVGVDGENPRKGVYAFFHPTFQEYFAAKDFCDRADYATLAKHIGKDIWDEIFILSIEMATHPDALLLLMKKQTDELVRSCAKLQQFLNWVYLKAKSVEVAYKPAAIRAIYSGFPLDWVTIGHLASTLSQTIDSSQKSGSLDEVFAKEPVLTLDSTLRYSLLMANYASSGHYQITWALQATIQGILKYHPELEEELNCLQPIIQNNFRDSEADSEVWKLWWQNFGELVTSQLRATMIIQCNIGHIWKFTKEQTVKLEQYYQGNILLVNCLKNTSISTAICKEIENTLLLPITEIEKYNMKSDDKLKN
ncbi:MAG: NACHT domain-containing NTPase [Richelia sp. SL_2_1]|nr:NACHT domain-containing NTPase [Richelia sp. SM1_7_0]NJN13077.1 NACHT domain-containing NTPase [Richelia sp. RM1_1_1]NJO31227.1 NACHT domain-containing NTPase [Richelia sp. SL_2_1]